MRGQKDSPLWVMQFDRIFNQSDCSMIHIIKESWNGLFLLLALWLPPIQKEMPDSHHAHPKRFALY
jgi:hypothetical protein